MPAKRGHVIIGGPGGHGTGVLVHGTADKGRAMLLEVPDRDNFTIILKQRAKTDVNTSIGIMPSVAELKDIDVTYDHPEHGYFVDITDGKLYGQDGTTRKPSGIFGGQGACTAPGGGAATGGPVVSVDGQVLPRSTGLAEGQVLKIQYCRLPAPRLSGAVAGGGFMELKFASPIANADYHPCILIFKTTSVQVAVEKPTKRPCTALARMWDTKSFTDAEVVCGDTVFPVHRAVLAAESPVFAAAFGGQMQEASSCRLEVKEASASATEALLRYLYTRELDWTLASEVLPLAHYYQLMELAYRCGEQMLEAMTLESAASTTKALRGLRDDQTMAPLWKRVLSKLDDDKALRHAVIEGIC